MKLKTLIVALGLALGIAATVMLTVAPAWVLASRNSSGTYTLPAGNPVVTGTTISSTVANNTLSDIGTEITDSLDRSGKGGMLAQLALVNGSVSAPSVAFTSQTNTGLYRAAASDLRCSLNGADAQRWTTTANFLYGPGTAPSLTGTYAGVGGIGGGAGSSSSTNLTNVGLAGVGGTSSAAGVVGIGGTPNGNGGQGTGTGTGNGLSGTGGTTSGAGLFGTGGTPNGMGVNGVGVGTGIGGQFANGTAATGGTRQDAITATNGDINLSGVVNPTSTTGLTNRLTPKNLIKAWVRVATDGAGNATVSDGFNITSTVIAGQSVRVNLAAAMANTNYGVNITSMQATGPAWGTVTINSTSQFDINLWTATATQVALNTAIYSIMAIVLGAQ